MTQINGSTQIKPSTVPAEVLTPELQARLEQLGFLYADPEGELSLEDQIASARAGAISTLRGLVSAELDTLAKVEVALTALDASASGAGELADGALTIARAAEADIDALTTRVAAVEAGGGSGAAFYPSVSAQGLTNGVNASFTLPQGYTFTRLAVYLNGLRLAEDEYTLDASGVTLATPPQAGDRVLFDVWGTHTA